MKTYFERPVTRGGTGFNDEHVCGYWSDSDKKWDSQRSRAEFFKTSKIIKKYCLSSEIQRLEFGYLASSGLRVSKIGKKWPISSYVRQRSSTGTVDVANMSKIISHLTITGFVCLWISTVPPDLIFSNWDLNRDLRWSRLVPVGFSEIQALCRHIEVPKASRIASWEILKGFAYPWVSVTIHGRPIFELKTTTGTSAGPG